MFGAQLILTNRNREPKQVLGICIPSLILERSGQALDNSIDIFMLRLQDFF